MIHKRTVTSSHSPEVKELLKELTQTRNVLETARSNFDEVREPELVDCYIYEMKAAQLRYQFLLQTVKKLGV